MYSHWRVKELKEELKKRGASLQGKKADLVERLDLYDQNFNFGRPECIDDDEPEMELPPNESYRDINSDTILPPLDKTMIRHYLCCTQKKIATAVKLYETRHLLMARCSVVGPNTFIKGYCRKTMKNLQYEVNIKLNKNGNPEYEYGLTIEPSGIFISSERPYLAASPDGLLEQETIIEIKCPYTSRHREINITTVPYLEKNNGILTLKKTSPYYYQIQGQLYCSGRTYCNLVIYTYMDLKVIYIEKDNYFINAMLLKLDSFYPIFKKALFDKYIYYNYNEIF